MEQQHQFRQPGRERFLTSAAWHRPKVFFWYKGLLFMHHQRTELLFLALISIFNFLLPHFYGFVQVALLSVALGSR